MPNAFDMRPVEITHHPTQRHDEALSNLPKLTWDQLLGGFSRAMKTAFGVDITSATGLAQSIKDDTGIDLISLGQMVDILFGGFYDGSKTTWSQDEAWRWVTTTILQPLGIFLDGDSPLDAGNLFGRLLLPISSLTNKPYEALWNPSFRGSISMYDQQGGWVWDNTVYRPGPGASSEQGSAKVVCDGDTKVLVSNRFALQPGEFATCKIDVMYHDLASTGVPIQVHLVTVDENGIETAVLIGSAPPASTATGWVGAPTGAYGKHIEAANPYEIPEGAVEGFFRLTVGSEATSGTVWLDAASVLLTGNGIPTDWLTPLVAAMRKMSTPFADIDAFFSAEAWDTAWEGFLDILGMEYDGNDIVANRNSLWTRLFQSVIPQNALNLHPDMTAVNTELSIILDPLGTTPMQRAQAWDDMLALFNIESHAANSQAWWDDIIANLFPSSSNALWAKSGAQAAQLTANAADGKAVVAQNRADDGVNWLSTFIEDLFILIDVLHLTYPIGSVGDPVYRTIGGKRTWYSAWNRLLQTLGLAKAPPPPGAFEPVDQRAHITIIEGEVVDVKDSVQTVTDAVRQGADGSSAIDSSAQDASYAVAGLRNQLTDLKNTVDDLTITARPGGQRFRAMPGGTGSDWGVFALSGATAAARRETNGFDWASSGNSVRTVWGRYPTAVNTDTMMVQVTFYSAPGYNSLAGSFSDSAKNMIFLRGNINLSDMVYVKRWGKGLKLYARVSNVDTEIGSYSGISGTGTLSLYCLGNTYTVFWNNAQVIAATSALVAANSNHRYCGMGMESAVSAFNEWVPGMVAAWLARDAAPVTVQGSGMKIHGANGASQSASATILTLDRLLFNAEAEYQTDDIAINAYTSTPGTSMLAQVSREGWYLVSMGMMMKWSAASNSNAYFTGAALLVTDSNGNNQQWYQGVYLPSWNNNLIQVQGEWLVYCAAGSLIQPAAWFSQYGHTASVPNATGQNCWFAVSRVGLFQ